MAEKLQVDLGQLHHLQVCLDTALTVMEQDAEKADDIAEAVGDGRLADAIRGYSTSWKKHRFDIRDRLTWLKDSLGKIETSFEGIDTELANALAAPPKAATQSLAPNTRGSIVT